jgi:hypothetical protein
MAEKVVLSAPVTVFEWTISRVIYDWDGAAIYAVVRFLDGRTKDYTYGGSTATTLMRGLNKADCSVKSQLRRVMERLAVDFPELAGTVSGAPD